MSTHISLIFSVLGYLRRTSSTASSTLCDTHAEYIWGTGRRLSGTPGCAQQQVPEKQYQPFCSSNETGLAEVWLRLLDLQELLTTRLSSPAQCLLGPALHGFRYAEAMQVQPLFEGTVKPRKLEQ